MQSELKLFLDKIQKAKVGYSKYKTYGYQKEYQVNEFVSYGYVPFILKNCKIIESFIPLTNKNNRPGILKKSTEYIVVHDTASAAPGADAVAHKNWLLSMANDPESKTTVSWHFTVDDKCIINHVPIDEVCYHAGDGTRVELDFIKTKIKKTDKALEFSVSDDSYYVINGNKTEVKAPNDAEEFKLPTLGINYKISDDGYYLLSNTYYNNGYRTIANRGGNLNSIGIEMCVNYGSDYITTMKHTAFLVAKLLVHYNLDITRVKQHNHFSGKDCPMTLRKNIMWDEFIQLVELNYICLLKFNELEFFTEDESILDKNGNILNSENRAIKYKVVYKDKQFLFEFINE